MENKKITKEQILIGAFILFAGFCITMASTLNPFTRSMPGRDSSVQIYFARMTLEGRLPYKEMFDHKGSFMHLIDMIGLTIAGGRTVGIWFLEWLSMCLAIFGIYKMGGYLCKNKYVTLLSSVACIFFITPYFEGGNMTEEWALPFIIWSLYIFVRFLKSGRYTYKAIFFAGMLLGAVLLIRANMIAVWIVWPVVILFDILAGKTRPKEKIQFLLKIIICFFGGIVVFTVPFVLWNVSKGTLSYFVDAYWTSNLVYSKDGKSIVVLLKTIAQFVLADPILPAIFFLYVIVFAALIKKGRISEKSEIRIFIGEVWFIFLSYLLMCMSGNTFPHYAMVLIPCLAIPFLSLTEMLYDAFSPDIAAGRMFLVVSVLFVTLSGNFVTLMYESASTVYYGENDVSNDEIINIIKKHTVAGGNIFVSGGNARFYNATDTHWDGLYYYVPYFLKYGDRTSKDLRDVRPDVIVLMDENDVRGDTEWDKVLDAIEYIVRSDGYEVEWAKRAVIYSRR